MVLLLLSLACDAEMHDPPPLPPITHVQVRSAGTGGPAQRATLVFSPDSTRSELGLAVHTDCDGVARLPPAGAQYGYVRAATLGFSPYHAAVKHLRLQQESRHHDGR